MILIVERKIRQATGSAAQLPQDRPVNVQEQFSSFEPGEADGFEEHRGPADKHYVLPHESSGTVKPATGQYRREGLCEGMPAFDLSVPFRELFRDVQSRVPSGSDRSRARHGRSWTAIGFAQILAQANLPDSHGKRRGQEQLCARVKSIPSGTQHRSTVVCHDVVLVRGGHEVRPGGARAA